MQRVTVAILFVLAAGLVPSTTAKADCSPSLGEYATLANFTILAELLDATSLYGALNNTAFTAFAPTDMAFMNALELLDIPAERLVAPDVIDTLTGLLSFHVALAPWSPANLTSRASTNVSTAADLPFMVKYNSMGKPSPLSIDAGDSTANIDLPNAISIPDCKVYVYPVDNVLLPTGAIAALTALISAPAPAPSQAAAISG